MSLTIAHARPWIPKVARAGLIAKGFVYAIIGALGFMAAFEIGRQQTGSGKTGALHFIKEFPGGKVLLVLLTLGLICYSAWRLIQSFSTSGNKVKWPKRVRYLFSAIIYLSVAGTALQVLRNRPENGNENQYWISEILSYSFGHWLVGLGALVLAGIGVYQVYYGLSEKYRKHVQELSLHATGSSLLLRAGKIGYISRGIVWLTIAYLFIRAAFHNNSSEAGDTGKAFEFIESSAFGSYMLGALGIGLIAYGIFNFIRARYETFK